MELLSSLILAFLSIVIVNNLVLTKFLGICPYLGVSGRVDMAFGMGCAVTFVVTLSGILTWLINQVLVLFHLEVMQYVCFILVIAGAVQLVEMYVRKFFPALYESFGIFLPLITTNCAILGLCLFVNISWDVRNFLKVVVLSFGAGIGFTLAICIMAGIRERLELADVPDCLKGAPITLVTAGLLALAFTGFKGMIMAS